tara:strand:+ start:457 stop:1005 length:549 start_codon:yes stop_codon:yes gene_type:complete
MKFKETSIKGNFLIDLEMKEDSRGFFARYFCEKEFKNFSLQTKWVQINNSMSRERGTLRGLHYQRHPNTETKLIRCLKGSIWDVVVDLRKDSDTFGKWFGAELSESNRTMMYVPEGFAHGFISLQINTEIIYLVSEYYEPSAEGTLLWNDSDINIKWPIKPSTISDKDKNGTILKKTAPLKL